MGVRYRAEFTSDIKSIEWKIDIHDEDYGGAVTTFNVEVPGFTITYEGNDTNKHAPIVPSSCSVHAADETSSFKTMLGDIAGAQEQRFSVVIYKGGVLDWAGHILNDLIQEEDAPFPFSAEIKATDYLAALKDFDYDNDGTLYTGTDTIINHIGKLLSKTNLAQFWGASANYLRTACDWWEYRIGARATNKDPLDLARFDHSAFYIESETVFKPTKVYDALEMIMYQFGCRLIQSNGVWNVIQVNEYNQTSISFRYYNKSGSVLSTALENAQNITIDQSTVAKIATGIDSYLQPLNTVARSYKGGRNFLQNIKYPALTTVGDAKSGFKWEFRMAVDFLWIPTDQILTGQWSFQWNVTLKMGTQWARGRLNTQPYNPYEWVNSENNLDFGYRVTNPNFKGEWTGFNWLVSLPENVNGGQVDIKIEFDGIFVYRDGYTSLLEIVPNVGEFEWKINELVLQGYNDDIYSSNVVLYSAQNQTGGAPTSSESSTKLPNTKIGQLGSGRLETSNGVTWGDGVSWKEGATAGATDDDINQLVVDEVISERMTATKIMNARIDGDILAIDRLTYDSVDYILSSVSFSASMDRWDGNWLEIHRAISAITQIATIDEIDRLGKAIKWGGVLTRNVSEIMRMINSAAFNDGLGLTSIITLVEAATTLTEIDITALGTDVLQVGDVITIIDPTFSGNYEELTVNADQEAADITLTIESHEFTYDYPLGAILFIPGIQATEKFKYKQDGTIAGLTVGANVIGDSAEKIEIDTANGDIQADRNINAAGSLIGSRLELTANNSNVSNPPTDAQLDAIFTSPAALKSGGFGVVTDSNTDNNYLITSDGTYYYVFTGTKVSLVT